MGRRRVTRVTSLSPAAPPAQPRRRSEEFLEVSNLGTDPQSGSGRIVVGVDGSSHSEEALRWALGQARLTGQPVDAVISWRTPVEYGVGRVGAVAAFDWEGLATSTLEDTVARAADSPDADRVSQRVVMG